MKKNAIIIGATSGIGKALAERLSKEGYVLGLTGRRLNLLEELQEKLSGQTIIKQMDVTNTDNVRKQFQELSEQLGEVHLVIISAGIRRLNLGLNPMPEIETIQTNVSGFAVVAGTAFDHFKANKKGHLVGISSIAALRGSGSAPAIMHQRHLFPIIWRVYD